MFIKKKVVKNMQIELEKVKETVLSLSEKERALIARVLIKSLEEPSNRDYETEWEMEIEKRAQEIMEEKEKGKDADEVIKEAYSRLK